MTSKKIISVIISLVIIAGTFSIIPISVSAASNVITDTGTSLPSNYGTNLVYKKSWYNAYAFDGIKKLISPSKNGDKLTDGSSATGDVQYSGFKFANVQNDKVVDHSSYGLGDYHLDIVFDLKSDAYIDGLALITHATKELRLRDFEFYASSAINQLFEKPIFKSTVNKTANGSYRRMAWNFKGMMSAGDTSVISETVVARYVAIRVFAPTGEVNTANVLNVSPGSSTNNIYCRFEEIAIYGRYLDPSFVYKDPYTPIIGQLNKTQLASYGESLIANRKANGAYYTDGRVSPHETDTDCDPVSRVDYNSCTNWDTDGSHYLELEWQFSSNYKFTNFLYLGADNAYATGWYQIYISEHDDTLFNEENMVFEYNAVREYGADAVCSGAYITLPKPVYGRYIAIRIVYPVTTATAYVYPRLQEFCAYGTWAKDESNPYNMIKSMPVSAYLMDDGEYSDYPLTPEDTNKLFDNNPSTSVDFKTSGKTLELVTDFFASTPISEYILTSIDQEDKYIKKCRIYASNNYKDVFDQSSLIYDGTGNNNKISFTPGSAIWATFVRFEIPETGEYTSVAEIEAIGKSNLSYQYKNICRELSHSRFSFFTLNLKNGQITQRNDYEYQHIAKMHDSRLNTTLGVTAGKSGEISSNILISFTAVKSVQKVILDFPYTARLHFPTKARIYLGVDKDYVCSLSAKPVAVFDTPPIEDKKTHRLYYEMTVLPTPATYVRIEFTEGGDSGGIFDEMVNAVTELAVWGTDANPINLGSKTIAQFTDNALGITWGINKAHSTDFYNKVYSSTVEVSDVTNRQKASLEKTPFMKINDKYLSQYKNGKKYTFKFFDVAGNELKDFANRPFFATFKTPSGTGSSGSAAYTGNKWYATLLSNITTTDNTVTLTVDSNDYPDFTFSSLTRIKPSDPYWESLGDMEEYPDETPEPMPGISTEIRSVSLEKMLFTYSGTQPKIAVKAINKNGDLIPSHYYKSEIESGILPGEYSVKVTFSGLYSGTRTLSYYIVPIPADNLLIKLSSNKYTYNGKLQRPKVTVTDKFSNVIPSENYTVKYENSVSARKYKVTLSFKGNYTGTKAAYYKILPKAFDGKIKISKTSFTYIGKAAKPKFTVTDKNGNSLPFSLTLPKAVKVGKYTAKVTLKGNYKGSKTFTFKVLPKGTSIKSVKAYDKSVKVSIKKIKKEASGYEILYSKNKSFIAYKKVKIKSNKKASVTVSKLTPKKKYYFKIRTYKTVNGKKYYSGWSAVKSKTVK